MQQIFLSCLQLLNQLRKVDESSASFRLYDLVSEQQSPKTSTSSTSDVVLCNGVPLLVEKASPAPEEAFVFDVYYAHCGDIDDTYIDQLLRWALSEWLSISSLFVLKFC